MDAYFPTTAILIWSIVFQCARFENQRWVRARRGGFQGANVSFGNFVDATRDVALFFVVTLDKIGHMLWRVFAETARSQLVFGTIPVHAAVL